MSRLFDPVSLLNQDLGENETRRELLPIGEVIAQIGKLKFASGKIQNGERAGENWDRLDASLEITDPAYLKGYADGEQTRAVTNLGVMLEMTPEGTIATGMNKNIRLGKLREAAGVNGRPLGMLQGQMIRIMIGHKQHPTELDSNGAPVMLDEVTGFTRV